MDPTTLVLTAVSSGAAAAAKDTVSQAVKDAYAGLKSLVINHFKGNREAETAFEAFERDPETWRTPLEKTISDSAISTDAEVIAMAQRVLQLALPEQHSEGKFNVQTTGPVQGQQIGDFGKQRNVFGVTPPKP